MSYLNGISDITTLGALPREIRMNVQQNEQIIRQVLKDTNDFNGLGKIAKTAKKMMSFDEVVERYNRGITVDEINKKVTMHFEHIAGDKLFIDFTGQKLSIVDRQTGEVKEVEVFAATLGYSQFTYVEAFSSQKKEQFLKKLFYLYSLLSNSGDALILKYKLNILILLTFKTFCNFSI